MPDNIFRITRALPRDAQLVAEFGAARFIETFRGTCTEEDLQLLIADFYNLAQVQRELEDPLDYFFLLWDGEELVAYSRLKSDTVPLGLSIQSAIELKRLYVIPAYHGRGAAAALMSHNEALAQQLEFRGMYLSVWEHNTRAKAFYRKMGFVDSGLQNPFPIGNTPQMDYWYVKDLSASRASPASCG
ncbi:MAG: GNAT family N-acetyltransferase [Planctomycetales bacterium]|nr:GNAT family N-acetyltransferase [Planctomycetales bacterium]